MNTAELVVELQRGQRAFEAFTRGLEMAEALRVIEDRIGQLRKVEAQTAIDAEAAAANAAAAIKEAGERAAEAKAAAASIIPDAERKAEAIVAKAAADAAALRAEAEAEVSRLRDQVKRYQSQGEVLRVRAEQATAELEATEARLSEARAAIRRITEGAS